MDIDRHSSVLNAAYFDLRRSLLDDVASDLRGSPQLENRSGRKYWYDLVRIGTDVRKRYIGEQSPDLDARMEAHRALAGDREARRANRARLVRILRADGYQPTDPGTGSLLAAMADAGAFRLGATLIGTQAFRLYEGELGIKLAQTDHFQTDDIDIAQVERLSVAVDDRIDGTMNDLLQGLSFAPVPSLHRNSVWRWRQTKSDVLVEFLTPSFRDEEDIRDLPALRVAAQSLQFLNFLLAAPIRAAVVYRSGVLIQIPRPEAFAIHKLIVADRRAGGPDQLKARKDRAQAALLIRALAEDRPDDLKDAQADALSRGPKWRDHIGRSLARMPREAAILAAL